MRTSAKSAARPGPGKKPVVAVDARMISHSGIGTYLRNVLGYLAARESFRLVFLGDEAKLKAFPWADRVDVRPFPAPIYSLREQWALPCRVPACDVFWSPHFNIPLLPIRARRRMVTIHDVYHLDHAEAFGPAERTYARILFGRAVACSNSILTVSDHSRMRIEARLPAAAGKVTVIPNGVERDFGQGFPFRKIQEDYLLFVGNLKPNKNLGNLLRAFALIADEFPALKLYAVGRMEGFLKPDNEVGAVLRSLPEDRVRMIGEVPLADLKNYYANARLFVFPSRYEGFGLPLLEAMCFDLPIAASAVGPMMEVGGDSVRYFDPDNAADMAETLRQMLSQRAVESGGGYRERLERFSWGRSGESHEKAIVELLDRG